MKVVHVAAHPMEAELIAGYLRAHGIDAAVEGQNVWAVRGEVPVDSGSAPRVLVRDADHERAKALLGERLPGGACNR